MPKLRDTTFDPFSSPDGRGLHPNAFRTQEDPTLGNQERYEARLSGYDIVDDGGPSPRAAVGPVTGPRSPKFSRPIGAAPTASAGSWGWIFGIGAIALGAYVAFRKSPTPNPGVPMLEGESLSFVPSQSHAPVQVTVNVGTPMGMPAQPVVVSEGMTALPAMSTAQVLTPIVVEEAPKKKRRRNKRVTTQAKDENGKFLPAGTAPIHKE
jgi:hypothetical protein